MALAKDGDKRPSEFRAFGASVPDGVRELYRLNHARQTVAFVRAKRAEYAGLERGRMGIFAAIERLGGIVDASDPDTQLSQLAHGLQTAEALREAGKSRLLVLTGFLHDLGKVLVLWGEPQWAVVGDTFPVGCAFSDRVVYPEFFDANPDQTNADYTTRCGIYREGCGLDAVLMSWGHDEYLYQVLREHLPEEALYVLRYHSFYAAHRDGAYGHLMDAADERGMAAVRAFNPFDLYSKSAAPPDWQALRPYYEDLTAEFLPDTLDW